ncbi:MAG: Hsp33 family molecular chaperone HslO [Sandaracinaceae bacterium]|nr:Hsp33 family molecular chaperone HslO [Sandaracinaceae bacterium]
MTDDGAFRVIAAITTQTVRDAIDAQKPPTASLRERFADLLTGAILVRETMAPGLRVQGFARGADGRGLMVADSYPDGGTRGLVQLQGGTDISFAPGAVLQMMRTLPNGAIHRGTVEIPDGNSISGALMQYFQTSEQVVSMAAVGTWIENEEVKISGGYIVQLLPEVEDGPLAVMAERLKDFESMMPMFNQGITTPDAMLFELLYGMPYTRLEESNLEFKCRCSELTLLTSLATLPPSDIHELIEGGEVLQIACDFCGKNYDLGPELLRGMLDKS